MPPQPPPPPEETPDNDEFQSQPSAPDAERYLVGTVLQFEDLYESAGLKSSDFYIHRWRWVWEAFEAILARNDHIDYQTVTKELVKSGHWEEVNARESLLDCLTNTTLHLEANAALVREMAERRRMLAGATLLAKRACDLSIPLPVMPGPVKQRWTLEELAAAEFPEPAGPVPGIIPNGLTVLGGRPKRGKSWLMLQAGCSLAAGGKFLERDLHLGRVLYYALEDRPKRLKERTAKLGIPAFALIEFVLSIQPLHLGGMAEVENAARHGGYAMIIIDTIRRAMPGKDFNKDGALFDDVLGKLQSLAGQCHLTIVCILHTRKASFGVDPDPVDDVLGSTGLTASADCVLALYTEQGKKGATLKGRGRDLDDIDLALQFDPLTSAWQSLGESGQAKNRERENEILEILSETGKAQAASIARTLGKDYSNTHKFLAFLWIAGKVKKEVIEGKTFYFLSREKETQEVNTQSTQNP